MDGLKCRNYFCANGREEISDRAWYEEDKKSLYDFKEAKTKRRFSSWMHFCRGCFAWFSLAEKILPSWAQSLPSGAISNWHILTWHTVKYVFIPKNLIWYGPWLYFLNCHSINELMTFWIFLAKSCYWNSFLLSFQDYLLLFTFFIHYINMGVFIPLIHCHHCLCSMDKRGGRGKVKVNRRFFQLRADRKHPVEGFRNRICYFRAQSSFRPTPLCTATHERTNFVFLRSFNIINISTTK